MGADEKRMLAVGLPLRPVLAWEVQVRVQTDCGEGKKNGGRRAACRPVTRTRFAPGSRSLVRIREWSRERRNF